MARRSIGLPLALGIALAVVTAALAVGWQVLIVGDLRPVTEGLTPLHWALIVLGSLGENATLSADEKVEVVRFFSGQDRRGRPLIPCIAESSTRDAKAFAVAAEEAGAGFVPVMSRFGQELKRRARNELFVRDGHCNDAGYALMAELVAPAVAAALTN